MPRKAKADQKVASATGLTETEAATIGVTEGDSRDPNSQKRPPRVSLQRGENLSTFGIKLDRENYRYYWFSESQTKPGRVQGALAAYYEHVVGSNGKPVSRNNGNGGATYLMRLPMEYWKEDEAAKRKNVALTMGENTKLGANEYAPTATRPEGGASSVVSRSTSDNPYA